jgi:hypothetical protein
MGLEQRELVAPGVLRTMRGGKFENRELRKASLVSPRRSLYPHMVLKGNPLKP